MRAQRRLRARVASLSERTRLAGASRMRISRASATGSEAIEYSCWRPLAWARTRPAHQLLQVRAGQRAGYACCLGQRRAGLGCAAQQGEEHLRTVAARAVLGVAAVAVALTACWPASRRCCSAWPTGCAWSAGCGRRQQISRPGERGAVMACYNGLAYLGFAVPYLMAGLGGLAGQAGAFGVLAVAVALLAAGTAGYAVWLGRARSKAAGSERAVAGRRYAPAPGSSREDCRAG